MGRMTSICRLKTRSRVCTEPGIYPDVSQRRAGHADAGEREFVWDGEFGLGGFGLARLACGSGAQVLKRVARQAGGLTNDEVGADPAANFLWSFIFFCAREEIFDRLDGELVAGHADGGEGWDGVFGEVDVVEADEREVVRYAEVGFEEGVLNADGGHVVRAHDGGGPVGESEDLVHGIAAAVEGVIAFDEPVGIGLETDGLQAAKECSLAALRGAAVKRAADEGDVAMAEDGEMLHALVDAGAIVDGEDAVEWARRSGVDEDVGDVFRGEAIKEEVLDAEGHDGDTIDFALEHAAGADFHGLGLVVGGADEDLVAARDGDLLELLDEFGEEGVGDFGDDEAEETALSGDESSCLGVGKVVEFGNGFPDARGEDGVDGRDVIDGAGDGGDGDACERSDAANVDFGRCRDV